LKLLYIATLKNVNAQVLISNFLSELFLFGMEPMGIYIFSIVQPLINPDNRPLLLRFAHHAVPSILLRGLLAIPPHGVLLASDDKVEGRAAWLLFLLFLDSNPRADVLEISGYVRHMHFLGGGGFRVAPWVEY
jgi:hypothetical protein